MDAQQGSVILQRNSGISGGDVFIRVVGSVIANSGSGISANELIMSAESIIFRSNTRLTTYDGASLHASDIIKFGHHAHVSFGRDAALVTTAYDGAGLIFDSNVMIDADESLSLFGESRLKIGAHTRMSVNEELDMFVGVEGICSIHTSSNVFGLYMSGNCE